MSRVEYCLSFVPALVFIAIYALKDQDVWWLFCATWVVIHTKADQIRAEVKKAKE